MSLLITKTSHPLKNGTVRSTLVCEIPDAAVVEQRVTALLAISHERVEAACDYILAHFQQWHKHLPETLLSYFEKVSANLPAHVNTSGLSLTQKLLVGACFTRVDYLNDASYFSPALIPAPYQYGLENGARRFLLSYGVKSEARRFLAFAEVTLTGQDTEGFQVDMEQADTLAYPRRHQIKCHARTDFLESVVRCGVSVEEQHWIKERLSEDFEMEELDALLEHDALSEPSRTVLKTLKTTLKDSFSLVFKREHRLQDRLLPLRALSAMAWSSFDATYHVLMYSKTEDSQHGGQQMLTTSDFLSFENASFEYYGEMLAEVESFCLFPAEVYGQYWFMGVHVEKGLLVFPSCSPYFVQTHPENVKALNLSPEVWEINGYSLCGAPLKTEAGWLVLTEGHGPMGTRSLGAFLLDNDDPTKVIGKLEKPLHQTRQLLGGGSFCGSGWIEKDVLLVPCLTESKIEIFQWHLAGILELLTPDS